MSKITYQRSAYSVVLAKVARQVPARLGVRERLGAETKLTGGREVAATGDMTRAWAWGSEAATVPRCLTASLACVGRPAGASHGELPEGGLFDERFGKPRSRIQTIGIFDLA